MISHLKIALIGCGKMGSALLRGWLKAKIEERVYVLDPAGLPEEFNEYAPNPLYFFDDPSAFADAKPDASVYVIAVKPQIMDDVCSAIAPAVPRDALILSIAAGQKIENFEKHFGDTQPVIRAMPNTPSAIGQGITVATANQNVTGAHNAQAEAVLKAIGAVEWVDDETLLDPVTAVSGSGPAYVFLLIEAMAKAGEKAGLSPELSMKLARQTVIGSAALAAHEADTPASKLRENVTSPGGTTAAALNVLMDSGEMQDLFDRAIATATTRGKELGKS